jgi:hypothetical protein
MVRCFIEVLLSELAQDFCAIARNEYGTAWLNFSAERRLRAKQCKTRARRQTRRAAAGQNARRP